MERKVGFVFVFLFLFALGFANAQEEQGGIFSKQGAEYMESGIIINTLMYDVVKMNENITIYMTPYELTGKTLDSTDVDCRVGIVNPDGSRLFLLPTNDNFTIIGEDDIWTATIPGSFLNETGEFLFNWDCHDNLRGGYFNSHVLVNAEGQNLTEGYSIVYMGAITILILIIIALLIGSSFLPKDSYDDDSEILQVSNLKHLRLVFYGTAYVLTMAVFFISSNITLGYFNSQMIGNLLFVIFRIMFYGMMVILPLTIIKIFVDIWKDKEVKNMLNRGVDYNSL